LSLRQHIRTLLLDCLWLVIFLVSSPWLVWRMLFKGKNRRGWKQKFFGLAPVPAKSGNRKVWLHAVSVGEVHVLQTLIEELQKHDNSLQLFISTTTETGFDRATDLFAAKHSVFFFPFDFSWAIKNVIKRIEPELLVLAELELWPNLIHIAADKGLPVMVANGRLSENSFRNYKRLRWFTTPMFGKLSEIAVQDQTYAKRFVDLGADPESVTVTGNLKYDSIETNRSNPKTENCRQIAKRIGFESDSQVFVAGSTQIEDEQAAVQAWISLRSSFPNLKLILVPRHPQRAGEAISLLQQHGFTANLRSTNSTVESDVLIVDVIGELSGWWGLADVAFVGGSMGSRGGQNMIEPAAFGVPVCFGPNTVNFKTTVDGLLECEAAKVVHNAAELAAFATEMLSTDASRQSIGKRAQAFVLQNRGAVGQTAGLVFSTMSGGTTYPVERVA